MRDVQFQPDEPEELPGPDAINEAFGFGNRAELKPAWKNPLACGRIAKGIFDAWQARKVRKRWPLPLTLGPGQTANQIDASTEERVAMEMLVNAVARYSADFFPCTLGNPNKGREWAADPSNEEDVLKVWIWLFVNRCYRSRWLTGDVRDEHGKPRFLVSLSWLLADPGRMGKLLEGKWDDDDKRHLFRRGIELNADKPASVMQLLHAEGMMRGEKLPWGKKMRLRA